MRDGKLCGYVFSQLGEGVMWGYMLPIEPVFEAIAKHRGYAGDLSPDSAAVRSVSIPETPFPLDLSNQPPPQHSPETPAQVPSPLSNSLPKSVEARQQQLLTPDASTRPSNQQHSTQTAHQDLSQVIRRFPQLELNRGQTSKANSQKQLSNKGAALDFGWDQLSHTSSPRQRPTQGFHHSQMSHDQQAHDQIYKRSPSQPSNQVFSGQDQTLQSPVGVQIPRSEKYPQSVYTECHFPQSDGAYGYTASQGLSHPWNAGNSYMAGTLQGQTYNLAPSQSGTVQRQGRSDLHALVNPSLNPSNQATETRPFSESLSNHKRGLSLHLTLC